MPPPAAGRRLTRTPRADWPWTTALWTSWRSSRPTCGGSIQASTGCGGRSASITTFSSAKVPSVSRTSATMSAWRGATTTRPESICATSSSPSISAPRRRVSVIVIVQNSWRRSAGSARSSIVSTNPWIEASGVRSSWLTWAMKSERRRSGSAREVRSRTSNALASDVPRGARTRNRRSSSERAEPSSVTRAVCVEAPWPPARNASQAPRTPEGSGSSASPRPWVALWLRPNSASAAALASTSRSASSTTSTPSSSISVVARRISRSRVASSALTATSTWQRWRSVWSASMTRRSAPAGAPSITWTRSSHGNDIPSRLKAVISSVPVPARTTSRTRTPSACAA